MRLTIRWMLGLALFVIGALALGACGGDDEETPGAAGAGGQVEEVSLLMNWFPQAEQGGYFQAEATNLGETDGVSLKVDPGGPQIQTIPQVAAGEAAFGIAQADEIVLARAEDVPIVEVFAPVDRYLQCLMFQASANIDSFEDIEGHPVAVAPSGGFWPFLKAKYDYQNVDEINFTGSLSELARNPDLVQQCFITSEPYTAQKEGISVETLMVPDAGYNPYAQGLFTTERYLQENPEKVRAVVKAVQQGWGDFLQDPSAARQLVLERNEEMTAEKFDFAWNEMRERDLVQEPIGPMESERWNELEQAMKTAGVLEGDVDVSKAYTNQYIPRS